MLNRRQLRIKILQSLYAFFQSDNQNYLSGEKELLHSISRMYDMYIYFLLIFSELKHYSEIKLEEAKQKHLVTESDLNPNRNFIDNKLIKKLIDNRSLKTISDKLKINWIGDVDQDIIKKLYSHIITSESYIEILNCEDSDFSNDRSLCINLFKKEICNFNIIHNLLEDKSIYWLDDIDHVCSMVIKTLKSFNENSSDDDHILPLWKEDEKDFAVTLFRKTIKNNKENDALLTKYTKNWEQDRLAKMDIILMNMAICEARGFSSIPVKVTLNEYIEISKFYSTPKSNGFINGVLDKVFEDLKKDGSIVKAGRGLIQ